ncbi:hypothetical protein BU15DRAFT_66877 [Melanogaster broomeanus]|nr:hypothetical protein BU15DRAFT_66877 [Melanogaster broomeanus]
MDTSRRQCELFGARVGANGLFGVWVTDVHARNAWVACLECGCWVVRASGRQVIIWGMGGLLRVRVARSRYWWSFGAPVANSGAPVACPGHGEPFAVWAAFLERLWPIRGVHHLFGAPVACPGHGEPFAVGAAFLRHLWPIRGVRRLLGAPEACPGRESEPFTAWVTFWSTSGLSRARGAVRGVGGLFGAPVAHSRWHGQPFAAWVTFLECQWPVRGVGGRERPFGVWVTFLECEWPVWGVGGPFGKSLACPKRERLFRSRKWPVRGVDGPFEASTACGKCKWARFRAVRASGLFEAQVNHFEVRVVLSKRG